MGTGYKDDASYLDACRMKRNKSEYDRAGGLSRDASDELLAYVEELRPAVINWLKQNHPTLV